MKKSEFKELVKPIIKECIKEFLLQEGILSVLSESIQQNKVIPQKIEQPKQENTSISEKLNSFKQDLKKEEIRIAFNTPKAEVIKESGKKQFGGFDPYAGTEELPSTASPESPQTLSGIIPGDPGVNLDGLFNKFKLKPAKKS